MAPKSTIRNLSYLQNVRIVSGRGELDGSKLADAFNDVDTSMGNLANQVASNPGGTEIIPSNVTALRAVHLGGGVLNFAITDTSEKLQRAVDYVVEISTSPSFVGSETVHFSPSRNGRTHVPNGRWYVKAYSQYRFGGPPSEGVTAGPIVVSGSPLSALLPTQGCGTAQPGETGKGAGTQIRR